jgi:GTP:adenosylcobinamide-phosphate guanylyltransferase
MKLQNAIFHTVGEKGFIPSLTKIVSKDLPLKTSYALTKLVKEVETKSVVFQEAKNSIIKKYGEEKDGGINVTKENMEVFLKEFDELLNIEEEYDFEKIEISKDLEIELAVGDLINLEKVLEIK